MVVIVNPASARKIGFAGSESALNDATFVMSKQTRQPFSAVAGHERWLKWVKPVAFTWLSKPSQPLVS